MHGGEDRRREILAGLADMLDYPKDGLAGTVRQVLRLLRDVDPRAAAALEAFESFVESTPTGKLQEVYSAVFDWDTTFPLHVGHYLFGESYKRSMFLLELKRRYREAGFDPDAVRELPDHLSVMLRFLAVCRNETWSDELITEALLPVLDRIPALASGREGREPHPYDPVFVALRRVLAAVSEHRTAAAGPGGRSHG